LVLIGLSIAIWAILLEVLVRIKNVSMRSDSFEDKFWSGVMLEEFYQQNKGKLKHPMGELFVAGMQEWIASETNNSISAIDLIKSGLSDRIKVSLDIAMSKIESKMMRYMSFLSATASISPFIGLFGTVWGIMNSFKSIAGSGSAGLQVVAPGISEALFTTAIGIFVAVMSTLFYSFLGAKVNAILDRIDGFKMEMMNILSRELDMFSIKNQNIRR